MSDRQILKYRVVSLWMALDNLRSSMLDEGIDEDQADRRYARHILNIHRDTVDAINADPDQPPALKFSE